MRFLNRLLRVTRALCLGGILTCLLMLTGSAEEKAELIGRWDLVVEGKSGSFPSWLEVRKSGDASLVGSFVGQFGSARPIAEVVWLGGVFEFQVPPQWEKRNTHLKFVGRLLEGQLSGVTTDENGGELSWSGVRAPALHRKGKVHEGQTIELFNGRDLTGWRMHFKDVPNGWEVKDGVLSNITPGNDIITHGEYEDFRLQAEFRYPEGSNSGIYLRGRYEMQIEDNYGDEPESHKIGGIYGHVTPSFNAARPAGKWQMVEITLIGRRVTVVLNGERIIDRQIIPGITGGALDSREGEPGPIMIQGDHGPVDFRRIALTPMLHW